jgi:hypothetical protein
MPNPAKGDAGQSFAIQADRQSGEWSAVVHDGPPTGQPTRVLSGKSKYSSSGKVAVCPFCQYVHPKDVHTRLAREHRGEDAPLLAADIDKFVGKAYRSLTAQEVAAILSVEGALGDEKPFTNGLPAVPNEAIPPGNTWTVQASSYSASVKGAKSNAYAKCKVCYNRTYRHRA